MACKNVRVKLCRNRKGQFTKQGGKKRKYKKMYGKKVCKPGTTRKYKGRCGCKTKGGGFKFRKASACKR